MGDRTVIPFCLGCGSTVELWVACACHLKEQVVVYSFLRRSDETRCLVNQIPRGGVLHGHVLNRNSAFLDQAADKFFILSTGHSTTGLDTIVDVTGNNVKMTRPIEDLVFDEK